MENVSQKSVSFFLFFFVATPLGLWDLSSLTRDQIWGPTVKVPGPNHWTAREFPSLILLWPAKVRISEWDFPGGAVVKNLPAGLPWWRSG